MSDESPIIDSNKRYPGDVVEYIAFDATIKTAMVIHWVETTIVAVDTTSNEQVAFDQCDHIQWR